MRALRSLHIITLRKPLSFRRQFSITSAHAADFRFVSGRGAELQYPRGTLASLRDHVCEAVHPRTVSRSDCPEIIPRRRRESLLGA